MAGSRKTRYQVSFQTLNQYQISTATFTYLKLVTYSLRKKELELSDSSNLMISNFLCHWSIHDGPGYDPDQDIILCRLYNSDK